MKAFVKTVGRTAGKENYQEISGKTSVLVVMELIYILQRRGCVYIYN
jgi:hypothetical protein